MIRGKESLSRIGLVKMEISLETKICGKNAIKKNDLTISGEIRYLSAVGNIDKEIDFFTFEDFRFPIIVFLIKLFLKNCFNFYMSITNL